VGVFVIPVIVLLPIKFMALWFLAQGWVLSGVVMILVAKLTGLGISSYLFSMCKPKLLELAWVRWMYRHCLSLRTKAAKLLRPYILFIRRYRQHTMARFPYAKLLEKLRARMHNARYLG